MHEKPCEDDIFSGELSVPISCKLRVLLARVNLERAKQGQPPLSLRRLAGESGVSLSVVAALSTGQSHRIDYATIDRLLNYFSAYFTVTTGDLLVWEPGDEGQPTGAFPRRVRGKANRVSGVRRDGKSVSSKNEGGRHGNHVKIAPGDC